MSIYQHIPTNIKLNKLQHRVIKTFEEVTPLLEKKTLWQNFSNFFTNSSNKHPKGIYLHGSVGRGKTMLIKAFYNTLNNAKELVHYQNFMQQVHNKLHKLQHHPTKLVIKKLAKDIALRTKVLFLDEFEIKDITDAMLIQTLFKYLIKEKIFIVLTTNTIPDNLYQDGIQREAFLPFIKVLKKQFLILHLDSNKDYRYQTISKHNDRVIYPINKESKVKIQQITEEFCNEKLLKPDFIEVFGRKISFKHTCNIALFTDFNELFKQDLGYVDYVNICQHFQVIILEAIPEIKEAENDLITRFINFIDNIYFYKVLLFITLEKEPDKIYTKGKWIKEYKRTVSRLIELNSVEYLHEFNEEYSKDPYDEGDDNEK